MDDDRHEGQPGLAERRRAERNAFDGKVLVDFAGLELSGSARNVSESGVYFVAEGKPRVVVRVDGEPAPKTAEIVRIESLGAGRFGIAVRFVD